MELFVFFSLCISVVNVIIRMWCEPRGLCAIATLTAL